MLKIKKGDTVVTITGKDKGKKGKILKVFLSNHKVLVEGINIVKKTTRPSQKNQQGGIISQEMPIDISNVMLFCDKCSKQSGFKTKILEDGSKIRLCKRCGEKI
ncbi:MAG: 50S ribosomal protein L24 [Candidatus Omnitrophica bacterium]|nr:50S ribosomal protein L24 [Candidatus Omnitrophota bacterium]